MWSLANQHDVWVVEVEDELGELTSRMGLLVDGGSIFGFYGVGYVGFSTLVAWFCRRWMRVCHGWKVEKMDY